MSHGVLYDRSFTLLTFFLSLCGVCKEKKSGSDMLYLFDILVHSFTILNNYKNLNLGFSYTRSFCMRITFLVTLKIKYTTVFKDL